MPVLLVVAGDAPAHARHRSPTVVEDRAFRLPRRIWAGAAARCSIRGMDTRVWIDDPNPVFRMGLVCCLQQPGFALVGESSGFFPTPTLERVDVLVFDLGEPSFRWALGRTGTGSPRLLGLLGGAGPDRHLTEGMCTVLVRAELTPEVFLACLRSASELSAPRPGPGTGRRPEILSGEELHVLRLLAQGQGERDIARWLGFSRRAARGVVAGVVDRLGARSPAEAVARALRQGVL